MRSVTVEKSELLATLKENRKTHQDDFDIVWKAYKKAAILAAKTVVEMAKDLKPGGPFDYYTVYRELHVPENHVSDYDRAIEMLEWELDETVTLVAQDFAQLVQDEWDWKQSTILSNTMYTGSMSPSKF